MRESVYVDFSSFFSMYLCAVSEGNSYRKDENPAIKFSKEAKAGKYNDVSDQNYERMLQEAKAWSEFWLDKPNQRVIDILRIALESMDIDMGSVFQIGNILEKCYRATVESKDGRKIFPVTREEEEDFDEEYPPDRADIEEQEVAFQENQDEEYEVADVSLDSPQEINEWLTKRIYGQRKAIRAAAMLLYNHINGRKRNVLFVGPTGCGKTEIWRVCKQLYPNIHIIDSTVITAEGWKGDFKVKNIFDGMSRREAENAIFVFDEFDKLCEPKMASGGTNPALMEQNELLKVIEGTTLRLKSFSIDTSKISFVFCGSFERLTEMKTDSEVERSIGFGANVQKKDTYLVYKDEIEASDLVKYAGMRQEIAGRINQIVQLSPMTADAYEKILKDEVMSPLHQLERQYSVKLSLDKDVEQKLVQEAEKTRMGVRYLRSRIQEMLDEQIFLDCGLAEYRLGA